VGYDSTAAGQTEKLPVVLAMFHTCFNVTNTAILIGLIPQIERVVCRLLPEKAQPEKEEFRLQYIQGNLMQTSEISVLQAQKETAHFGLRVQAMFGMVRRLLEEQDNSKFEQLFQQTEQQEDYSDHMEIEIARFLEQVSENHLSDETKTKVRQMLREVGELESIGDACYNLARTLNRQHGLGKDFTPNQHTQLQTMMSLCDDALSQMNTIMTGHRHEHDIRETYRIENEINQLRQRLKSENIHAVNDHEYDYALGTIYSDIINECEKLGDYVVNVVQARFGK
jgi:phosphate:Na+ symporter